MERWMVKLVVLLVIFVVVFVFTVLPIKVSDMFARKGKSGQRVISYFMCFGGGVFLGVYMLHMAPDVRLLIDEVLTVPLGTTYPIADLIIVAGFFLMVFSENFVHLCNERKRRGGRTDTVTNTMCPEDRVGSRLSATGTTTTTTKWNGDRLLFPVENNAKMDDEEEIQVPLTNGETTNCKKKSVHINECGHSLTDDVGNKDQDKEEKTETDDHGHDLAGGHLIATRSLVLLLALSLHHVFEGLSIGLKQSISSVWNLCAAVVAHEVVIAFSLGMQMVKAYRSRCKIVVAALMCSGMIPLGMVLGIVLTETGIRQTSSMLIANGTLQGLATGVFIYVTFFEILQEELGHGKADFVKLVFMLIGFVVLALLALVPEERAIENVENDLHDTDSPSSLNGTTTNCSCPVLL